MTTLAPALPEVLGYLAFAAALGLGVLVGVIATNRSDRRKAARATARLAASELAFWTALQRLVDDAQAGIDAAALDDAAPIYERLCFERWEADL